MSRVASKFGQSTNASSILGGYFKPWHFNSFTFSNRTVTFIENTSIKHLFFKNNYCKKCC